MPPGPVRRRGLVRKGRQVQLPDDGDDLPTQMSGRKPFPDVLRHRERAIDVIGYEVAFGDVPGDRVDAGACVPLKGADEGVARAGRQHRGGGATRRRVSGCCGGSGAVSGRRARLDAGWSSPGRVRDDFSHGAEGGVPLGYHCPAFVRIALATTSKSRLARGASEG